MLNLLHAKKIALLIGNSNYAKKGLNNPTNDINLLAKKLRNSKLGFTVYKKPNLTKSGMLSELKSFYRKIDRDTIALIYFSGHGVHSTLDGKNYLIPIGGFDALLNESQLSDVAISDSYLLGSTNGSKFSILLLDACRSNDFAQVRGDKGLGQPPKTSFGNDYIISYATDVGKTAEDGYKNSPYALALSHNLLGDYPIEEMFRLVRKEVSNKTGGEQTPLYKPSFNEKICLTGNCGNTTDHSQELARLRAENERLKNKQNREATSTSKWITPTKERVTWKKAKELCRENGARLPTLKELKKVVTDCGGIIGELDKNEKNSRYQQCRKNKGFNSNYYWSSPTNVNSHYYAWIVSFDYGYQYSNNKDYSNYVRCVRAGQ